MTGFSLVTATFLVSLLVATPAFGQENETSANKPHLVNIDFKDTDIRVVIRSIALLTGKNFVVDDKVKGSVTIISPALVTAEEAMRVFESTMEVYGYSLLESGSVIKVIPANEARQRSSFKSGTKSGGDKLVTRVVQLSHVKAQDMVNTFRPMVPSTSYITSYNETNTLIITDYQSNITKILGIIDQLDTPAHEETLTVIHLEHAGSKELSERLGKLFEENKTGSIITRGNQAKGKTNVSSSGASNVMSLNASAKIISDDRINALIVIATKSATDQILALVAQLDIPSPPGRGGINVYYLKNADAEELSKVLNNITKKTKPEKGRKVPSAAPKLKDNVTITPDKATNSLVITASIEDYDTIKNVIEKLDIRRRQVFVEALILEVTTSKSKEFGVEWRTTSDFTNSGVQGIGGVDFGTISDVAENPLAAPEGLSIGVVDGLISFGDKTFLNLGALLHALQAESGINIISTPNIMTTDNEEAKIVVANNVPLKTSESQSSGGNTITSIERKDVGLTLKIKPQISESDELKLEVYQEISSLVATQIDKAEDLITSVRSIETTVVVKDGQNVALGGLMREDTTETESKVPFFGDIPGLGWLFKTRGKEKQKTNLLVFLTPHIIRSQADMDRIIDEKREVLKATPEFAESLKVIPGSDKSANPDNS